MLYPVCREDHGVLLLTVGVTVTKLKCSSFRDFINNDHHVHHTWKSSRQQLYSANYRTNAPPGESKPQSSRQQATVATDSLKPVKIRTVS